MYYSYSSPTSSCSSRLSHMPFPVWRLLTVLFCVLLLAETSGYLYARCVCVYVCMCICVYVQMRVCVFVVHSLQSTMDFSFVYAELALPCVAYHFHITRLANIFLPLPQIEDHLPRESFYLCVLLSKQNEMARSIMKRFPYPFNQGTTRTGNRLRRKIHFLEFVLSEK